MLNFATPRPHERLETYQGPEGRLLGLKSELFDLRPNRFLMLHPLTQGGGNLFHKVVTGALIAASESGLETLRFNFRGAGEPPYQSQGRFEGGKGELSDLESVVDQALPPEATFHLGGFSFGGLIAAAFAQQHPQRIRSLTLLAPAIRFEPIRTLDFPETLEGDYPIFVAYSDQDEIIPPAPAIAHLERLKSHYPHRVRLHLFEGSSHFFHGRLSELQTSLRAFFMEQAQAPG